MSIVRTPVTAPKQKKDDQLTHTHTRIHTFLSWATLFRTDKDLLKSNKNSKIKVEIINYSPEKMCIINHLTQY
jgi:hypothetical protein